jgi:hypothetical protein
MELQMSAHNESYSHASPEDNNRRAMLQTSAGLIAAAVAATEAIDATKTPPSSSPSAKIDAPKETEAIGKPGDFNFLAGEWRIDHRRLKMPGEWDRITGKSCRWHQSVSRDGGKTWEPNGFMDWKKV